MRAVVSWPQKEIMDSFEWPTNLENCPLSFILGLCLCLSSASPALKTSRRLNSRDLIFLLSFLLYSSAVSVVMLLGLVNSYISDRLLLSVVAI